MASKYDHAGKTSGKEMMKAWDAPGSAGGNVEEAGKVASIGGIKREAGTRGDKGIDREED